MPSVVSTLAADLAISPAQVEAVIALLDDGDTIPFIARYRKEMTGGLDDIQLRALQERLLYVADLEERRRTILEALAEDGIDDPTLLQQIATAEIKARLEDLYLPYRDKRRTKAQIAIESGLLPLADGILSDPAVAPEERAIPFVDASKEVPDVEAALAGARAILSERFANDADLMGRLRDLYWKNGWLRSRVREGKEVEGANFSDHFERNERFEEVPSHRMLAMMRGERQDVLSLTFDPHAEGIDPRAPSQYDALVRAAFGIADKGRPGDAWLADTARWSWRTKILVRLELDIRSMLWERAEATAIGVFATNLRDVLMAAPAGRRVVLSLDPGYRNGVKSAVMDGTGKVLAHAIVHLHEPYGRRSAMLELASLCRRHGVELIAIGNGTASRETDKAVTEIVKDLPDPKPIKVVVSEAGASVYSASAVASAELPDLDVSIRGAVSIGRRLQDPLAELVKIDPKSIGVGQYQHDISETLLGKSLDAVVEDCVNAVGVDLNTASPHLLARVSGLGPSLAESIVRHRDANGAFRSRSALLDVPRLGPKTFEQCAGFLRIMDGDDPLDRSGVHPESYPVVARILSDLGCTIDEAMGDAKRLRTIKVERYVSAEVGLPTIKDIVAELGKPGRDPRPTFATATFKDGIEKPSDLRLGMILEGTVSSVAAFGAFVDIGVHQDGLVHISALGKSYVDDPRKVVKVGQTVKVKVMSIDLQRNRIGLSMRLEDEPQSGPETGAAGSKRRPPIVNERPASSAMADALARAMRKGS